MLVKIFYFLALFFAALALGPALAHLFELPNKIDLSRADYLTVQQIYRGWALLGFVTFPAVISTLVLTLLLRKDGRPFVFSLIGLLCLAGTQVVFWMYTFPANQATNNWTMLPDGWEQLRRQWEYSHATSAVLNVLAVAALIVSLLAKKEPVNL
jgi:hypothetical protein